MFQIGWSKRPTEKGVLSEHLKGLSVGAMHTEVLQGSRAP